MSLKKQTPAQEMTEVPIVRLQITDLEPGPLAMRTHIPEHQLADLALSLSRLGQMNPIFVHGDKPPYKLIAGHRRTAAALSLGWTSIEARIVSRDAPELWKMAWDENEARSAVTLRDKAAWLKQMREDNGWTQAQLAEILHITPSVLSEILATLDYAPELAAALDAEQITFGVARKLNQVTDAGYQRYLINQATEYGCTVRTAEQWVRDWKLNDSAPQLDAQPNLDNVDAQLQAPTYAMLCAACRTPIEGRSQMLHCCCDCARIILNPPPG